MPNKKKSRDKSEGMKTAAKKPPVPRAQPVSVGAESRADSKLRDDAVQLVRPTTLISTNSAGKAAFEVASEALLSLIQSNFDALRTILRKTKDKTQRERLTSSKADEDLTAALNRLEVGYRELLRGN